MKKILIITAVVSLLFSSLQIRAQQKMDLTKKKEAISKLSMLAGHWQEAGWASSPDGQRHEFEQTEEIHLKLDGIALFIQGIGKDKEPGEVIHDAWAIITFDEASDSYSFQSHLSSGHSADAIGHFEGESFVWGLDVPGGSVRYTLTITGGTKWHEISEFSSDGSQWYKFIEMDLEKITQ